MGSHAGKVAAQLSLLKRGLRKTNVTLGTCKEMCLHSADVADPLLFDSSCFFFDCLRTDMVGCCVCLQNIPLCAILGLVFLTASRRSSAKCARGGCAGDGRWAVDWRL